MVSERDANNCLNVSDGKERDVYRIQFFNNGNQSHRKAKLTLIVAKHRFDNEFFTQKKGSTIDRMFGAIKIAVKCKLLALPNRCGILLCFCVISIERKNRAHAKPHPFKKKMDKFQNNKKNAHPFLSGNGTFP